MTKDEANNLLDELIQAAYEHDTSHGRRAERLRVVRARLIEVLTASTAPRPPTPKDPADQKLAKDWYTWGFQAGVDAERSIANDALTSRK